MCSNHKIYFFLYQSIIISKWLMWNNVMIIESWKTASKFEDLAFHGWIDWLKITLIYMLIFTDTTSNNI